MSITCTVCGTVNPDGTQFCEGCGVELTAQTAASQSVSSHDTPNQSATHTQTTQSQMSTEPAASTAPSPAVPLEMPPLEPVVATSPAEAIPAASSSPAPEPLSTPLDAIPTPVLTPVEAPAPTNPVPTNPVPSSAEAAASSAAPAETAPAQPVEPASTAPAPAAGGEAKLGIKKYGAATGEFIPLSGDRLVVGRFDASSGPVDIDLTGMGGQEHISRRHAELYRENGVWHVRDLGSTNGVYLKRKGESAFSPRLQEPAELHDGDELAFGNLMLNFVQG